MSEGIIGNITAVLYYMFFVISGIIIMFRLLNSQKLSIMFKCLWEVFSEHLNFNGCR